MKRFGWPVGLVALFLAAALAVSCSSEKPAVSGPGGAVVRFYEFLNAGNHAGAIELYAADARSVLDDPSGSNDAFGQWADQETKGRSVDEVTIVSTAEREDGTGAEVQFEVHYKDGTSVTRQVSVVQESGAWRLGFIS